MSQITSGTHPVSLYRFRTGERRADTDTLAVEEPLEIRIAAAGRERTVAITMRTPGADEDLALGFLFTEGILTAGTRSEREPRGITGQLRCYRPEGRDARNRIVVELPPGMSYDPRRVERHSYTSSSCGVCGKTSLEMVYAALPFGELPVNWTVPPTLLTALPGRLRAAQLLFARTGGIHAAGVFDATGRLLHLAEDVGRHNALDKLIGHYYRGNALPLSDRILVLSGRSSFELIQKAAMAGLGCVIAVGAPSSLAVALAEEQGMTLCGFVREQSFNCYAFPERIRSRP